MLHYFLQGEVPSKKNSRVTVRATGRSFPNARYREWHGRAMAELRAQGLPSKPLTCAAMRVDFTHSTRRRRDGDNQLSSVLDLLVDAGALKDDSWQNVPSVVVSHSYGAADRCALLISDATMRPLMGREQACPRAEELHE